MDNCKQQLGQWGEAMAREYLERHGLRLIEQNYSCRMGEIDLIMRDQEDVVLVEVRCRSRLDYGTALDSVNKRKMRKIIRAGTYYLQQKRWLHTVYSRFDIVAIHRLPHETMIEWIKNAFSAESNHEQYY